MTKEQIQNKFDTDYRWLFRAVLAINAQQTADERTQETVKYHNNRGFTPSDAKFLCSVAKQIKSGYGMSQKQIFIIRKKMKKYIGQCMRLAKAEIKITDYGKLEDSIRWTHIKNVSLLKNEMIAEAKRQDEFLANYLSRNFDADGRIRDFS